MMCPGDCKLSAASRWRCRLGPRPAPPGLARPHDTRAWGAHLLGFFMASGPPELSLSGAFLWGTVVWPCGG